MTHAHVVCEATAHDLDLLLGRLVDVQALVVLDRNLGFHHGDHHSSLGVDIHQAAAGVDRDDLERSGLEGPYAGVVAATLAGLVDAHLIRRDNLQREGKNSSRSYVMCQKIKQTKTKLRDKRGAEICFPRPRLAEVIRSRSTESNCGN